MTALRWPAKRAVDVLGAVGGAPRARAAPRAVCACGAPYAGLACAVASGPGRTSWPPVSAVGSSAPGPRGIAPGGATAARVAALCTRLGGWLRSYEPRRPARTDQCAARRHEPGRAASVAARDICLTVPPSRARRHELRPGMTGWAAVQGGSAANWERRRALDVWYVDNWSLVLDLKILLMAFAKVMKHESPRFEGPPTSAARGRPRPAGSRGTGRAGSSDLCSRRRRSDGASSACTSAPRAWAELRAHFLTSGRARPN